MSRPPARPANAPEIAIARIRFFRTLMPPYARRLGVEADRAHLVAERRPVEDDPEDDERGERDEEADVRGPAAAGSPQKTGSFALVGDVVRDRHRRVLAVLERPAVAEEVRADPDRDPVEHDRRDHLVRADVALRKPAIPAQTAPASVAAPIAEQDVRERRHARRRLTPTQFAT